MANIIPEDAKDLADAVAEHLKAMARAWTFLAATVFLVIAAPSNATSIIFFGLEIDRARFGEMALFLICLLNGFYCIRHLWAIHSMKLYINFVSSLEDEPEIDKRLHPYTRRQYLYLLYPSSLDRIYPAINFLEGVPRFLVMVLSRLIFDYAFMLFSYVGIFWVFDPFRPEATFLYFAKLTALLVTALYSLILVLQGAKWAKKFGTKNLH